MGRSAGPVLLLFALATSLAGCGYTLVGSGLEGLGSVAIRTPENTTQEPGAEFVLADALRRELLRREGTALVEDPDEADVVVTGKVLEVSSQSKGFSSAVLARERELDLRVDLRAVRRDGTEISPHATLVESERYLASSDVEVQRRSRQEALRRLSGLLAARFFDRVGAALP